MVFGLFSCSTQGKDKKAGAGETIATTQKGREVMPALAMTDVNGKTVNLNSFKGKKVFVNLWATWCPPCRAEIPSIEALSGKTNPEEVVFIMLSLDQNFETARKFAGKEDMILPVYAPAENLPALFNTKVIPATFIFNETGELVKQNDGSDDYDSAFYVDLLKKKPHKDGPAD